MPANVTHMLIAHKAIQTLKAKGIDEFTQFAEILDDASRSRNFKAYMNLGSLTQGGTYGVFNGSEWELREINRVA